MRITTVKRGGTSSFLSHDVTTGKYQVLPNVIRKKDSGSYKVEVVLVDSKHGEKNYFIHFNVNCTIEGNFTAEFTGKVLETVWKSKNPPLPILRSFSQTGLVVIEFTYKMIPPQNISFVTNGTIWIDGVEYPALEVQILSSDLEVTPQEMLGFTWECLNFTEYTLTL